MEVGFSKPISVMAVRISALRPISLNVDITINSTVIYRRHRATKVRLTRQKRQKWQKWRKGS